MMHSIMRHLKRKHGALYTQLVWMEPMGAPTWCVWVTPHNIYPKPNFSYELSRSSSKWMALYKALKTPVRES